MEQASITTEYFLHVPDLSYAGATYVDPNVLVLADGRMRLITMKQATTLYSFISSDGRNFALEQGYRLHLNDFTGFKVSSLNDPKLVRLKDGRYRIYVAALVDRGDSKPLWTIVSATTKQAVWPVRAGLIRDGDRLIKQERLKRTFPFFLR